MLAGIVVVILGGALIYALGAYLYNALLFNAPQKTESVEEASPEELACDLVPVVEQSTEPEFHVEPLIVKHLDEGRSTVLIRRRERRGVVTGQLLVWSGAKRKKVQDSLYDLGVIKAAQATEEVIERFVADAMNKLYDLKTAGRKRKQVQRTVDAEESVVVSEVQAEEQVIQAEEPKKPTTAFPDVYRGVITAMGFSPREIGERTIEAFGITYLTDSGDKLELTGSHLRHALKEADAGEGDKVEIVKVGKKTMGKGMAPMQLFQVSKIG